MRDAIIEILRERNIKAEATDVVKNGVVKEGIIVGEGNIRATVYVESYAGVSAEEAADDIALQVNDIPDFNVNELTNPDFIREHATLCIQKKSDEDIMKKDYLDLEVYVRCVFDGGSYKLNNNHDISLFDNAVENTLNTFEIIGMSELMYKMMGVPREILLEVNGGKELQYVVMNSEKTNAASCLYYPEIFRKFCIEKNIDKCYIIPSSIHEVIVAIDNDAVKEDFDAMVSDVNTSALKPEEVLSNHCYIYTLEDNSISY